MLKFNLLIVFIFSFLFKLKNTNEFGLVAIEYKISLSFISKPSDK
jgi:hypothetical protein